jgi:hypothetical protein
MTAEEPPRNRDWWKLEALRTRTDWFSLMRQRMRVLAWLEAGRPPLSKWIAQQKNNNGETYNKTPTQEI